MPLSGVRSPVGRAHHHLFLQSSKTRASQEPARSRPSPSFLVQERAHCSPPSLSSLSAHPKCKTMAQNTPSSVLCDSTTALLQAVQRQSRRLLRHPCESCLFPRLEALLPDPSPGQARVSPQNGTPQSGNGPPLAFRPARRMVVCTVQPVGFSWRALKSTHGLWMT